MTKAIKKAVQERAKHCCEYCLSQSKISADIFVMEHIIPLIKGGTSDLENLALACQRCNNHKYTAIQALDSATGLIVPLYHPRIDIWEQHFQWSDDFTELLGISPIGRATIQKLQLNRQGLINLRQVFIQVGLHPPY
jgi:hypothetical protein